jgi:hypothetical protein
LVISERAYRLMLAAYPDEFRRRYGAEMAQVFRTTCRAVYQAAGVGGVVRLWLPTLWDWAWSAAVERFSSLFRRSDMYHIHPRRAGSQLIPILFFLNACLILLFVNPCSWVFGEPFFGEQCWLEVSNQSHKTLRVTPIDTAGNSYAPVRLYRETYPIFPAYQQHNILVKYGGLLHLPYSCEQQAVSVLYACDLDGECYVHRQSYYVNPAGRQFTFESLESLARPEAALEAAVGSFPEHNYSVLKNVLLCIVQIVCLIGGVYGLVRARTIEIPKHDI